MEIDSWFVRLLLLLLLLLLLFVLLLGAVVLFVEVVLLLFVVLLFVVLLFVALLFVFVGSELLLLPHDDDDNIVDFNGENGGGWSGISDGRSSNNPSS